MKKGKKMPSIEVAGDSEAEFVLKDGKIIRIPASKVDLGDEAFAETESSAAPEGPKGREPRRPTTPDE